MRVNRWWYQVAADDTLWRPLCDRVWLLRTRREDAASWYAAFAAHQQLWGRYRGVYSRVRGAWDRFLDVVLAKLPRLAQTLGGTAIRDEDERLAGGR